MPRIPSPFLAALALACACLPAIGQTFQPQTIRFTGVPDYSDQELLGALNLAAGTPVSYAQMNADAQKLVDTGLFATAAFKFDGRDLVFQLASSPDLLPLRLQNLPLHAGKDLEAKLHQKFPLYHGLLPQQGGLTESVRAALEQMLAAQNIKATVSTAPFNDAASRKMTAVNFVVTSPQVLVGDIRTEGAIVALDPKASLILAKYPGAPYDATATAAAIEMDFTAYYKDQGYADPAIHVTASPKAVFSAAAIRIPLRVALVPGPQYKLGKVQLAPGLLVSQTDFDQRFHFHAGDTPDGDRLRAASKFIEQQYHDLGYIKAQVQPVATADRTGKTISYNIDVAPGPVYTMGKLTIDNVTDELRSAMLAAWKLPSGAVFNESIISAFFSSKSVNPALQQVFSGADYRYTLLPNDALRSVDVNLALEKKH